MTLKVYGWCKIGQLEFSSYESHISGFFMLQIFFFSTTRHLFEMETPVVQQRHHLNRRVRINSRQFLSHNVTLRHYHVTSDHESHPVSTYQTVSHNITSLHILSRHILLHATLRHTSSYHVILSHHII